VAQNISGFMKQNLLTKTFALLLLSSSLSFSQAQRNCGTEEHTNYLKLNRPGYSKALEKSQKAVEEWITNHQQYNPKSNAIDTIPVVVHVVYATGTQNISDAQVKSQIRILNEDFGRLNVDSTNTPAVWQPISGRLPYRFVLARRKPDGSATNGIDRVSTTVTSFNTNDNVKFTSSGGANSWDVTKYLNIWVCNLGNSLLGYGEFPVGTPSNTYGFVCHYKYFGDIGTATAPFDKGRTTTHEIGHCFNLNHIWGDDFGSCSGSDNAADTPNQGNANYGCPTFPLTDNCSNTSPGVMFMNYMDYTDDACMNMFTKGQATRIIAAVSSFYPTILNSIGLQPPAAAVLDASPGNFSIASSGPCSGPVNPSFTLYNFGVTTLTSATITYSVDGGATQTYNWTGSLASNASTTINLPSLTLSNGNHSITIITNSPNGSSDLNTSNDNYTQTFTVNNTLAAIVPLTQNFAGTFPPAGYSINNPDNNYTWIKNTTVGNGDNSSLSIDNYNNQNNGQYDEFVLPPVNLISYSSAIFKFDLAYQLYTDPAAAQAFSDTLEVFVSTDCGNTYNSVYKKFSTALTTTASSFNPSQFTPSTNDWRTDSIVLNSSQMTNNVIFKFRNTNDYENFMFIDNINISGIKNNGIEKLSNTSLSIFPNPASNNVTIQLSNVLVGGRISIKNILGSEVYSGVNLNNHQISIDVSKWSKGTYFVQLFSENVTITRKLIIE
jgi:hypothetical protein